jgi:hypothetical protein
LGPKIAIEAVVMRALEKAARAEVKALPAELAASTAAKTVLNLARRLDSEPADREAVLLARELRLALSELHRRAGDDVGSELEAFLAGIASPAFRGPGN